MKVSHLFCNLLTLTLVSACAWTARAADLSEERYQEFVREHHHVRLTQAEFIAGIGTRFDYIGHFQTRRPGLSDRDSIGGRHRVIANSVVFNVKTGTHILLNSVNIYCGHHVLCGHGANGRLTAGQPLRLFLTAGAAEVTRVEVESTPEQSNTEVLVFLERAPAGAVATAPSAPAAARGGVNLGLGVGHGGLGLDLGIGARHGHGGVGVGVDIGH